MTTRTLTGYDAALALQIGQTVTRLTKKAHRLEREDRQGNAAEIAKLRAQAADKQAQYESMVN